MLCITNVKLKSMSKVEPRDFERNRRNPATTWRKLSNLDKFPRGIFPSLRSLHVPIAAVLPHELVAFAQGCVLNMLHIISLIRFPVSVCCSMLMNEKQQKCGNGREERKKLTELDLTQLRSYVPMELRRNRNFMCSHHAKTVVVFKAHFLSHHLRRIDCVFKANRIM